MCLLCLIALLELKFLVLFATARRSARFSNIAFTNAIWCDVYRHKLPHKCHLCDWNWSFGRYILGLPAFLRDERDSTEHLVVCCWCFPRDVTGSEGWYIKNWWRPSNSLCRNLPDCVGDNDNAWLRRPIGYCGRIWRRDGYESLLSYFLSVVRREEAKKRRDIMHSFNCSRAHSIFIDSREEELLSSTRKLQAQLLQLEIPTQLWLGPFQSSVRELAHALMIRTVVQLHPTIPHLYLLEAISPQKPPSPSPLFPYPQAATFPIEN